MKIDDALKWLENLKNDIGKSEHSSIWHYEQAIVEIGELLKGQKGLMLALEQSNASNECLNNSVSELGEIINILKDEIKRLKAEQPKKGKWIVVTNGRGGHECSVCHNYAPSYQTGEEHLSKYCHECGAVMVKDGEQDG